MSFQELNRDIINNRSNGRVLWQPRIICWYDDRKFRNEPLPAPYTGMSVRELYDALECSNRIYDFNSSIKLIEDKSIKRYQKKLDDLRTEYFAETPEGTISCILSKNRSNYGEYFQKWWVETQKDMEVQMYIEAHQDYAFDADEYDKVYKEWGENGLGSVFFPRINVQSLFNDTMGVENGIYALMDMPDVCKEYFKIKAQNHDRFAKMLETSRFEWINYGDNVHCATLTKSLFEEYVLPEYQRRNEIMHRQGKFTFAHWDGDTKTLLPYAKETGLDGIEAITPKPQGDVEISEIKKALGNNMVLIDGIAAVLFDEIYPIERLKGQAEELIEQFGGKLILGISDEMSSTGNIDRVKFISELVSEYNAKL